MQAIRESINLRLSGPVPAARASNWTDAMYALGWLHGRYRGAQIALMRAVSQGRICECFADSDDLLEVDRHFRRLGFARDARRHIDRVQGRYREDLKAYCTGVNMAWRRYYPWWLRITTGYPAAYEPEDVLSLLKLMAYAGLAEGQRFVELFLMDLVHLGVDDARLSELFPALEGLDREIVLSVPEIPAPYPGCRAHVPLPAAGGSNAWVCDGSRTASGEPLLANDPHLEVNRLPAVMFECSLDVGTEQVKGATVPGLPGIVSGRNRQLSWGVTYSCADTSDFFVEWLRDGALLQGGERVPLEDRRETFRRRDHEEVRCSYRQGPHGVLEPATLPADRRLSWRWTGLDAAGTGAIVGLMELMRCTRVRDARRIMHSVEIPTLHMVFADTGGNIGYQFVGSVPRRRPGWSGLAPAAGWTARDAWRGRVDPETDTPGFLNPESGCIVITNEARQRPGGPALSTAWLAGYRKERIEERLRQTGPHDAELFQSIQYDTVSRQAARFVPRYLEYLPRGEARSLLERWDLAYTPGSRAATLFEDIHQAVALAVFGRTPPLQRYLRKRFASTPLLSTLSGFFDRVLEMPDSLWLPATHRAEILREAIPRGAARPVVAWGERNRIGMNNIFLGDRLRGLPGLSKKPFPLPGNHATVCQGSLFNAGRRQSTFAACYHMVADMSSGALWTNLPGGRSESFLSRGYREDLKRWREGAYKLI